jgi:RNA methyltransferase, TrmH family
MLNKLKIKYIQSLSQKKLRGEKGLFIAEGPKIVEEILRVPNAEPLEIFATNSWIRHNLHWKQRLAENIVEITDDELDRISSLQTPNQVLGLFRQPVFAPLEADNKVSLMLDGIQDPGNLGTIIRCADWFGIPNIICSVDCVDVFNSKVVQSTMGSICRVQVLYRDLVTFIGEHSSLDVYAASLEGDDVTNHPTIEKGIILIGNESKGISADLLAVANHRITIRRKGNAESLNAAVATGIILSHLV